MSWCIFTRDLRHTLGVGGERRPPTRPVLDELLMGEEGESVMATATAWFTKEF